DVWGYVGPDGTEYALVGVNDGLAQTQGLSIVSLSDPANPVELHHITLPSNLWRDIDVYGHYAYVSNEGGPLTIVDLSGLPATVTHKKYEIAEAAQAHTLFIDEKGYLYLNGVQHYNGGIVVFDLNRDPWNPEWVGVYDTRYVHDSYIRGDTCYSADIYDGLLTIIDLEDRELPQIVGEHTYVDAFTHNTWLNDAGTVCFSTDEVDAAYVYAWDISDPSGLQELGKIRSPLSAEQAIPHNVYVKNDYLVIAYYKDGVYLADAHNPDSLTEVGYFDTSPLSGPGFDGVWAVYPFLPSGLVLAADWSTGLWVLQAPVLKNGVIKGIVTDSVTGQPLQGVAVDIQDPVRRRITLNNGSYIFPLNHSGTHTLIFSKPGYYSQTMTVTLSSVFQPPLTENVELVPLPRTRLTLVVKDSLTGAPLPGARIEALSDDGKFSYQWQTNSNGVATELRMVSGVYELYAGKWGYHTRQLGEAFVTGADTLEVLLSEGYRDEFALDLGWEISGAASRQGKWERTRPRATFSGNSLVSPAADLPGDLGNEAWVTEKAGFYIEDSDVDELETVITSPPINVNLYNDAYLRYNWWVNNFSAEDSSAGNDILKVELMINDVAGITIGQHSDTLGSGWHLQDSIRIVDYLSPQIQPRLRFTIRGQGFWHITEAAVDGVEVFEGNPIQLSLDQPAVLPTLRAAYEGGLIRLFYSFDRLPAESLYIEVSDLQGHLIGTAPVSGKEGSPQIEAELARGMYIASIRSQKRILKSIRFVY
ncbi:MAG: choice-of-anchor B family protein, partial [Bacteroidetes bacterium]